VILLLASAGFFLLELKHPGIGLPTVGGAISLVLGGLLLFNPSVPGARVSLWLIATVAAGLVLFFGVVVKAALRARRLPAAAGLESLAGEEGVALSDLDPGGRVRVRHEEWSAVSAGGRIAAGAPVRVVRVEGLRAVVELAERAGPRGEKETGSEGQRAAGGPALRREGRS
jgi:membrane-bound serine protease (ClpP class)